MSDAVVSEVGVVEVLIQDSVPTGSSIIEVAHIISAVQSGTIILDVLEEISASCLRLGMIWLVL